MAVVVQRCGHDASRGGQIGDAADDALSQSAGPHAVVLQNDESCGTEGEVPRRGAKQLLGAGRLHEGGMWPL